MDESTFAAAVDSQSRFWQPAGSDPEQPLADVVTPDWPAFYRLASIAGGGARQLARASAAPADGLAWYLYALTQRGLTADILPGFLVNRLRDGEAPPAPFGRLARLSWGRWRAFACLLALPPACHFALRDDGHYQAWMGVYGRYRPLQLPLGLGEGAEAAADGLLTAAEAEESVAAAAAEPAGGPAASGVGGAEAADPPPSGGPTAGGEPDDPVALWLQVREELRYRLPRDTYERWLQDAVYLGGAPGAWEIGVASEQARAWVTGRLLPVLERTLADVTGTAVRLDVRAMAPRDP